MTVKACPECGNICSVSCWHEGKEEVPTVEMDVHKVLSLLLARRREVQGELEDIEDDLMVCLAGIEGERTVAK